VDIVSRVNTVLAAEPNEAQLDKFLADLRESLAASNKQFISISLLALVALVSYHLVAYEGVAISSFQGVPLPSASLFKRVFIVVPAALLSAVASIGFLRRCQREVYDYLAISRYRVLAQTQLHELRLPSDYILGLFYLKLEGGLIGQIVSWSLSCIWSMVFVVGPVMYTIKISVNNIKLYGFDDVLVAISSITSILLAGGSFAIVVLASRIHDSA
jgi:hypothetical protein